jgi:DNA-binding NtrC family response regulator
MSTEQFPENPVLVVDDEEQVVKSLTLGLTSNGITNVLGCQDGREVMRHVSKNDVEVVLLDLTMPHVSGKELLSELCEKYPQIPVIVVTGTNEVQTAVECMKTGAFDYMVKAVETSRLVSGVRRAIDIRRLKREYGELKTRLLGNKLSCPRAFSRIITVSSKMHSIFLLAESVAKSREPVLITGETGVGKNLVAKAIHDVSAREGKFEDVNVAGFEHGFFGDDLFGHLKDAFTGAAGPRAGHIAQAKGGTLFLDEIGDLVLDAQIRLLKFLDTGEYLPLGSDLPKRSDARVVVATNRNLVDLIRSEKFRKDLYYRLSTHEIKIPHLRERKEDLPVLLGHFLQEAADELGIKIPAVPRELLPLLETYDFPGNVRELRSMVFDAVTKMTSHSLSLSPFKEHMGIGEQAPPSEQTEELITFKEKLPTKQQAVDLLVSEALRRAHGNQSIAAHLLGISHQALSKWLKRNAAAVTGVQQG